MAGCSPPTDPGRASPSRKKKNIFLSGKASQRNKMAEERSRLVLNRNSSRRSLLETYSPSWGPPPPSFHWFILPGCRWSPHKCLKEVEISDLVQPRRPVGPIRVPPMSGSFRRCLNWLLGCRIYPLIAAVVHLGTRWDELFELRHRSDHIILPFLSHFSLTHYPGFEPDHEQEHACFAATSREHQSCESMSIHGMILAF